MMLVLYQVSVSRLLSASGKQLPHAPLLTLSNRTHLRAQPVAGENCAGLGEVGAPRCCHRQHVDHAVDTPGCRYHKPRVRPSPGCVGASGVTAAREHRVAAPRTRQLQVG